MSGIDNTTAVSVVAGLQRCEVGRERDPKVAAKEEPKSTLQVRETSETELLVEPEAPVQEESYRISVRFELDSDLGRTVVRVLNRETGELIRQVLPEELLAVFKNLEKHQGLLVNTES